MKERKNEGRGEGKRKTTEDNEVGEKVFQRDTKSFYLVQLKLDFRFRLDFFLV